MTYLEKFLSENPDDQEDDYLDICVCVYFPGSIACGDAFFKNFDLCIEHWNSDYKEVIR